MRLGECSGGGAYGVYLGLLHSVLLEAVHVGKGPVEASGRSHESVTMGRVGVHGRRGRRTCRKGQRRARDLHYVSAVLADVVVVTVQVKRQSWGQSQTGLGGA
jgi:hypothetical protein